MTAPEQTQADLPDVAAWRLIGPHRGGRVVAVAGDPVHPLTFYFGSTGGGVWKTTDAGLTWRNISDGFVASASVGALAVAPSDPNVLYAGMGEATIRGNVSFGDGVYRSTDGGKSWVHCGLADTRHIGKIRVHPHNPDLVYVAAFGHAFGPNTERGVFRSSDGGQSWEKILYRDADTGAIDLVLDPTNPRILYATLWQARRGAYSFSSGGPGSGLFRSQDGGESWEELSERPGLPAGLRGKIGIALSPAKPERVWALVEAREGSGLYRSDDDGRHWTLVSDYQEIRHRPWYYMHIYADPLDPETVWALNLQCWRSSNGGYTFSKVDTPHVDNHDLWIDPQNPLRMINGNDGGACVSLNGGISWSTLYNQPTAEMYHVTTDNQVPYRVYGSQQDNTAISLPSLSKIGAISSSEWFEPGGGESGYMAVRWDNPNIVYGGSTRGGLMTRYDRSIEQFRDITVWPEIPTGWPASDVRYRFQWTFPIMTSPHDPDILYATGNHVFRTTNEGASWEQISPDLTRADPATLVSSGGPITPENVSTEYYATIFAFAESPVERGVLWAGSDDGLLHVSRDNGASWQNVSIPDLPEWALISIIEPSPHDAATAWVAATRYKHDDPAPYLFRTTDFGQTWTRIVRGIAADDYTRVIREDPVRPGLLFAGTERRLYVSVDAGERWQPLGGNLPLVPIHDLVVHDTDLVVATHGRSFWILDDLTPLREWSATVATAPAHLFTPRDTWRFKIYGSAWGPGDIGQGTYGRVGTTLFTYDSKQEPDGTVTKVLLDAGQNPPNGVIVNYFVSTPVEGDLRLTFRDANGDIIQSFSSTDDRAPRPSTRPGINRFVWNMRYPEPVSVDNAVFWSGGTAGPVAPPGRYSVTLTVGGVEQTREFAIVNDPRVTTKQEDIEAQFRLQIQVRDRLSEAHSAINRIRAIRGELESWHERAIVERSASPLREALDHIEAELDAIEDALIQRRIRSPYDSLRYPMMLNNKLASLLTSLGNADAAPSRQAHEAFVDLSSRVSRLTERLQSLIDNDISALNSQARELDLPAIAVVKRPPAGE